MKNFFSLLVFFLMVLHLAAQPKTVNIHGIVRDTTIKSIEIAYIADTQLSKWENKTLNVVNGVFNTSLQIPFPIKMNIYYGNRAYSENYIFSDANI